jgi:hypothetical protein
MAALGLRLGTLEFWNLAIDSIDGIPENCVLVVEEQGCPCHRIITGPLSRMSFVRRTIDTLISEKKVETMHCIMLESSWKAL